jgi:hypothetical protein
MFSFVSSSISGLTLNMHGVSILIIAHLATMRFPMLSWWIGYEWEEKLFLCFLNEDFPHSAVSGDFSFFFFFGFERNCHTSKWSTRYYLWEQEGKVSGAEKGWATFSWLKSYSIVNMVGKLKYIFHDYAKPNRLIKKSFYESLCTCDSFGVVYYWENGVRQGSLFISSGEGINVLHVEWKGVHWKAFQNPESCKEFDAEFLNDMPTQLNFEICFVGFLLEL